MANTESDGKEKGAEVLGENALDGIAGGGGGGGEGMEAGLNLGNTPSVEEVAKRVEMLEQLKKFREDIVKNI